MYQDSPLYQNSVISWVKYCVELLPPAKAHDLILFSFDSTIDNTLFKIFISFLIKNTLAETAFNLTINHLKSTHLSQDVILDICDLFIDNHLDDKALALLEIAQIKSSAVSDDIYLRFAQIYLKKESYFLSSYFLQKLHSKNEVIDGIIPEL